LSELLELDLQVEDLLILGGLDWEMCWTTPRGGVGRALGAGLLVFIERRQVVLQMERGRL
jgi:hypothetical protein